REDLAPHSAVEHVPAVLRNIDAAYTHARFDFLTSEVRDTDEPRFPLANHVIERAHGLLEPRHVVRPVDQVHVHVVGTEIREALLDASHAAGAAGVAEVWLVAVSDAKLGDDDRVPAAPPKRLPERAFRSTRPVPLGGVEAVDAEFECPRDRPGEFR